MKNMKYKPGDKVRIKNIKWYKKMLSIPSKLYWIDKPNGFFDGIKCGSRVFTDGMCKFCGKVMTIQEVGISFYLMEEDKIRYEFTDEMIEGLIDEPQEQMIFNKVEIDYKVCDEVIFINTVSVKHEYRKQGVFKKLLNHLQYTYNKPIMLECFHTLVPMYKHLGFDDLGESDDQGYHLMKRELIN